MSVYDLRMSANSKICLICLTNHPLPSTQSPISYVVNTGDLTVCTSSNRIHMYADDTYIIVPACNTQSRQAELDHVAKWAHVNNPKLSREKPAEIVITSKRQSQDCNPPELPDIRRTTSLTILGSVSPTTSLLVITLRTLSQNVPSHSMH